MARKAISVNKQNEIRRLKELGLSIRAISRSIKSSRKTVEKYLSGPLLSVLKEIPPFWFENFDWEKIHLEHTLRGVPLKVLWEEEKEKNSFSVNFPTFWKQYNKRYPHRAVTMARQFEAGDRVEIDYCDGVEIIDPATGEIRKTHLFVGVLCFSRYTFAEFSYTQNSNDFLNSHVRMFNYFGGTPKKLSPDNLKSAVNKTHPYDPEINPAYSRLAEHYELVVEPARVRRPKDKAIVERTIQIFQRWFFMRVRHKTFTSLIELNKELLEALKVFHKKVHRILGSSREELFKEEKAALKELSNGDYIVQTHKKCILHSDCHLAFDLNYYSAPWKLRGEELDVWATEKQIKIFKDGDCVAIHARKINRGKFATDKSHYPPNYQAYLEVTPCHLREKAQEVGPNTSKLINELLPMNNPLKHLRRAQGLIALLKLFTKEELEYGTEKALLYNKYHLKFIEQTIKAKRLIKKDDEQISRTASHHLRGDALLQ